LGSECPLWVSTRSRRCDHPSYRRYFGGAWRLGGALGYEHSELDTSTNAKSDGDRFNGGGVLTYNPGALLLSAAVSGGRGSYDIERSIAFPGFSALAKGNTDIDNVDGRLRAAYLFDFGGWYLKPLVDLDATRLNLDGTNEHGAGGASLLVNGNDQTYLSASPGLELETQFANGQWHLDPTLCAGWRHHIR
jgi:outer membrane autotransporter protein